MIQIYIVYFNITNLKYFNIIVQGNIIGELIRGHRLNLYTSAPSIHLQYQLKYIIFLSNINMIL